MKKIDFKKKLKNIYQPKNKEICIVDVPQMQFLMIDGKGNPNHQEFKDSAEVLFSISYAIKFIVKQDLNLDYTAMPLEGLWWADDMSYFVEEKKELWKWTAMIMQPEFVTQSIYKKALLRVKDKKQLNVSKVKFESFCEGPSAQILYIGSYHDEHPTIMQLHSFIKENGYSLRGKHHEIYLSDPRKTSESKLKTILRHSFKKK